MIPLAFTFEPGPEMPVTIISAPVKVYSVRVFAADGSMMGSVLEGPFNKPLTRREAIELAQVENERSERRRAQKLPYAFEYLAVGWERIGQNITSATPI